MAAATAIKVGSDIAQGSATRRAADNRATALRDYAQKKLAKGKQEAELARLTGAANRTTTAADMLGRGVSRNDSIVGQSLEEITNRAEFTANQALTDAQNEYDATLSDAADISRQGRDAQKAAAWSAGGTILSNYSGYLQSKYREDAFTNGKWW